MDALLRLWTQIFLGECYSFIKSNFIKLNSRDSRYSLLRFYGRRGVFILHYKVITEIRYLTLHCSPVFNDIDDDVCFVLNIISTPIVSLRLQLFLITLTLELY